MLTLKNDFNVKVPLGVFINNPAVTLLTVLSCIPTVSATSFKERGLRKSSPFSRKSVCLLTISAEIFNVVVFLCSKALLSHLADARA